MRHAGRCLTLNARQAILSNAEVCLGVCSDQATVRLDMLLGCDGTVVTVWECCSTGYG